MVLWKSPSATRGSASRLRTMSFLQFSFHPPLSSPPRIPYVAAGSWGSSPPEKRSELFLAHHSLQFLEREEGNESHKNHDASREQFVPAPARYLLKASRQAIPVEQSSDRLLKHVKNRHPYTEHHRPEKRGKDQRLLLKTVTQSQVVSYHNHLGQDCSLDQREPVICVLDLILGQDEATIPRKRD